MTCNNPKLDLVNMNAYIKFGENMSSISQDIEQKLFCFCCFTSHVHSYGHCGTVSSLNHTFLGRLEQVVNQ